MQVTEPFECWDAFIGGATLKMNAGSFQIRIKINAQLTPELARILGCRDAVFLENGAPRSGIAEADLEGGCAAFHGVLTVEGLRQEFQLNGDSVSDLTVKRSSKEGLRLEMRLNYTGDPLTFIGYWKEVGAAQGTCKIRPLQKDLDTADEVTGEVVINTPSGTVKMPIDKDTLRKAVRGTAGSTAKHGPRAKSAKGGLVN